MHDIFGADVIELFDMKYFPDQLLHQKEEKQAEEDEN